MPFLHCSVWKYKGGAVNLYFYYYYNYYKYLLKNYNNTKLDAWNIRQRQ